MTYLHVGSRVPVLNKCWKAGTGVLIAKRSQRKSIFPKEQSDQEINLYSTLKSDNKEQMVETRGQTKSLHGKPFPTASQFQVQSRFEEGW